MLTHQNSIFYAGYSHTDILTAFEYERFPAERRSRMAQNLKNYFPSIRTRKEIMKEIDASPHLSTIFYGWDPGWQEYR